MKKELNIVSIKDNIVIVEGEHSYQFLEEIKFGNGINGIVLKANYYRAYVALVGVNTQENLKVGDKAFATGEGFTISILNNFFGSIIDVNGQELVAGNAVKEVVEVANKFVLGEAKPLYARKEVNQPLHTGTAGIDGILPIGKGQKELIVGDSGTGKTTIGLTAFIAQANSNVMNIYIAVGKKRDELLEIQRILSKGNVLDKTIIVATSPDDPAAAKFLVPYVGMAIAEHFQETGEDVLVVMDDLTNHADAYRELALSAGSAPGREAFPGDIFYTHSRLLEKCGRFTDEFGGGSITVIPIAQTLDGDISGYISTNLISITDGQIYTSQEVFNEGRKPAIEFGVSVSRLGSQVQTKNMTLATKGLKNLIQQYENMKKLQSFNVGSNTQNEKEIMSKGKAFELLITQPELEAIPYSVSEVLFMLLQKGFLSLFFHEGVDKSLQELTLLKDVIKTFLMKDVIGRKMIELMNEPEINEEVIDLYLKHIILPLIKYHLLSESKWLRNNPEFIKMFSDIRNDGRVLLAYERRGIEKGIAYEI